MKTLKIGDLLARLPIIQGGMGVGISLSGLASAVANQGGVGVISSAGLGVIYREHSKDYNTASIWGLREELRKASEKTKGIIGVNVMVAMSNFADMVRTAIAEKADIIFSGAGMPLNLPSFLTKGSKTKLAPIVSSARAAKAHLREMARQLQIRSRRDRGRGTQGRRTPGLQAGTDHRRTLLAGAAAARNRFGSPSFRHGARHAHPGHRSRRHLHGRRHLSHHGVGRRRCPDGHALRHHGGVRRLDGVQAELHRSLSTGHRDHPKSGGYAGAGHPQLFPGTGETRVETAQKAVRSTVSRPAT